MVWEGGAGPGAGLVVGVVAQWWGGEGGRACGVACYSLRLLFSHVITQGTCGTCMGHAKACTSAQNARS